MAKQQTTVSKESINQSKGTTSHKKTSPTASRQPAPKGERRGSPQPAGKPHRVTYDCTSARYRQLKLASMNTGESMNAIISAAIDDWLAAHPEALEI